MAPSATPEKRNRLSNIFGKRRSSTDLRNAATNDTRPSHDNNTLNGDSAYASSENSRTSPEDRTVPLENNGQISGVGRDRNLALDKNTNQVVDADTGETIVTTVTTTTTTTTVTKGKNGEKDTSVQVESRPGELGAGGVQGPGTLQVAEAPGDSPATHRRQQLRPEDARAPAVAPIRTIADGQPSVPSRDRSISGGEDPVSPASPTRHNFSYPSRSDLRGDATANEVNGYQEYQHTAEQQHRGSSTLENLKAAAIGLHGVGETLRSTLNSEVDARLSRRNPDKQRAAEEKNRADMARGEREMARLREVRGLQPTTLAPSKSQEAGYRIEPDNSTTHPAFRQQQQDRPYPPNPSQGRSPQPVAQQQVSSPKPAGFSKEEANRYQAGKSPIGRFRSPSQQAKEGYIIGGGPVGGTAQASSGGPASNVQAVSHVQNNGQDPEPEKKGLRGLFKKGKAAI